MKKIIILDFSTAITHIFDYDDILFEDISDFYNHVENEFGLILKESETQWMIVDEVNIRIH